MKNERDTTRIGKAGKLEGDSSTQTKTIEPSRVSSTGAAQTTKNAGS